MLRGFEPKWHDVPDYVDVIPCHYDQACALHHRRRQGANGWFTLIDETAIRKQILLYTGLHA